jgi:hypothetical protein
VLGTIFAPTYAGFSLPCVCFAGCCYVWLLPFLPLPCAGGAAVHQVAIRVSFFLSHLSNFFVQSCYIFFSFWHKFINERKHWVHQLIFFGVINLNFFIWVLVIYLSHGCIGSILLANLDLSWLLSCWLFMPPICLVSYPCSSGNPVLFWGDNCPSLYLIHGRVRSWKLGDSSQFCDAHGMKNQVTNHSIHASIPFLYYIPLENQVTGLIYLLDVFLLS